MRITVCELPHEPGVLEHCWNALCRHTTQNGSQLVLLPEFAFVEPVWQNKPFAAGRWGALESLCDEWLSRLAELGAGHVVGTRPVTRDDKRFNEGFMWSGERGMVPLRRKAFVADEAGFWESSWYATGDREFPAYEAGELSFGLNICTELWALETYGAYASLAVDAVLSPRGTPAASLNAWFSLGTVAALRAGAFCFSSNRVHPDGSAGGAGWIISPDGSLLGRTSPQEPFCTIDIEIAAAREARRTYPRYVFDAQ